MGYTCITVVSQQGYLISTSVEQRCLGHQFFVGGLLLQNMKSVLEVSMYTRVEHQSQLYMGESDKHWVMPRVCEGFFSVVLTRHKFSAP